MIKIEKSKLKSLFNLYLDLDNCMRKGKQIENKITKEFEKIGIEEVLENNWYMDSFHALASNGELNDTLEGFNIKINKILNGDKFYG